jgi:hypothetical protein
MIKKCNDCCERCEGCSPSCFKETDESIKDYLKQTAEEREEFFSDLFKKQANHVIEM